ncbi:aldehyde dehydrogenase family protein [Rhizobium jaguaris]|uniref:Aldehyde dehydrogenase family protein n=1 Tax=Rhizobium jaguaris TaxID=1312183 RepID=A0A387FY07_9HYPH|nr:aldehyde dehydrogenase family protein [Rhizobium jaguaris]AYG62095.1 aldehyde dehydrogenase family protein [Rhizobium jaguaris]
MSTLTVFQAFDRSPAREIPMDDAPTLATKLAAAAAAFKDRDGWLKTYERVAILRKVADLLNARAETFAKQIALEGGKPYPDAAVEVARAADGLRNAADELRNFAGKEIPMGLTPASEGRWAFTTKEPIGVVAAISAFNHPLNLIIHQIAPAIAVGCPVIIKPAAATPLSCLDLVALFREAGLEERWCQTLITDDNLLAEKLATDPRVRFLSFIGSAKVGWYLRSKLPPGTRCALEHGGAAPVLIHSSADIGTIIEPITKGAYYHAGQVCVSTQRIFVDRARFDDFVEVLSARVAALRVGDPLLPNTEVGPLIHPREANRVSEWIDEAIAAGAGRIGGGHLSETTLKPSILLNPPPEAKVSQLEVFGPVVCVYGYEDFGSAIEAANGVRWSFQASVFARDIGPALTAAQRLEASAVMINDHTAFRTDWMPFAGRKESGYGVGGIPWTMKDMSEEKMIVLRR